MRFSFLQLLLIVPAWCTAYLVAPYATLTVARITWRHDVAANDIRQIRLFAENANFDDPSLSVTELDLNPLWNDMGGNSDPWGNPYQLIEMHQSTDGFNSNVHAYSFGRDGGTQTDGNDLDDINSWNNDPRRFYREEIELNDRIKFLMRTVWLSPLVYLVLLIGYRTMWPTTTPNCR